MTQSTLISFLNGKKPAFSLQSDSQPPPAIDNTQTTLPSQEEVVPKPRSQRCAVCSRVSSELVSCSECAKVFHATCHSPEILASNLNFVCCICESARAPKRKRVSEKPAVRVDDIDVKIPDMFLKKEQRELRQRLKRERELKQTSLARNKELAAIVGVSDERKICPIFLKPSERTQPLGSADSSGCVARLPGCEPLLDFSHYNAPVSIGSGTRVFELRRSPVLDSSPLSIDVTLARRPSTPVSPQRELQWPAVGLQDEVERKKLKKLQSVAASAQSEISSVSEWLATRLDENKEETKRVTKFLQSWHKGRAKSALLVISGPPGSGKSSLAEAAAADCEFGLLEIWDLADLQLSEEALYSRNVACMKNNDQVILINDLDVLIANDRAATNLIAHYIEGAKRPVIVTVSRDLPHNITSLAKEVVQIDMPSADAVALTAAHRFGLSLPRSLLLAAAYRRDFRRVLLTAHTLSLVSDGGTPDPFEFSGLAVSRALAEGRVLDEELRELVFGPAISDYLEFALQLGVEARHLSWIDRKFVQDDDLEDLLPGILWPSGDFSEAAALLQDVERKRAQATRNIQELKEMTRTVCSPRDWLRYDWDKRTVPEIIGALSVAATADSLTSQRRRQCLFGASFDFRALQLYPKIR